MSEYIILKTATTKHKIKKSILKKWDSFFSGLLNFVNKDDIEIIEIDEDPKFLNVIITYFKHEIFDSTSFITITQLIEFLDRIQYYCIDKLERDIKNVIDKRMGLLTQRITINILDYNVDFIDDINHVLLPFCLKKSLTCNSSIILNIIQEKKNKCIDVYLQCKGSRYSENEAFTFPISIIEVRYENNRLIKRIENFTFWLGNDNIKIAEISEEDSQKNIKINVYVKYVSDCYVQ